jgi:hypothetical protein
MGDRLLAGFLSGLILIFNTLGAEGFIIISVASAGISAIFTHFRLKN